MNFASLVVPTKIPWSHPDSAKLTVLAQLIAQNYLHREVREKGGAYGSDAGHDYFGVFHFSRSSSLSNVLFFFSFLVCTVLCEHIHYDVVFVTLQFCPQLPIFVMLSSGSRKKTLLIRYDVLSCVQHNHIIVITLHNNFKEHREREKEREGDLLFR